MRKKAVKATVIAQEEKTSNGTEQTNIGEQSHLHVNDSSVEATLVGHDMPPDSNGLPPIKKDSGTTNTVVRRSVRLKKALPGGSQAVNPIIEHVNLVGYDKERASHSRAVSTLPALNEQNVEGGRQIQEEGNATPEKVEPFVKDMLQYLVQAVDEFKTQRLGQVPTSSNEDPPGFSYKTLYLDAQKKIDALIAENYELIKKLEYARGKVAAYERMKDAPNGSKEVLFVRATEAAAVSFPPQAVHTFTSPAPPSSAGAVDVDSNGKSNGKKRKTKA